MKHYRSAFFCIFITLAGLGGAADAAVSTSRASLDPINSRQLLQRQQFREAGRALQRNQDTRHAELLKQLQDYPLYPYLVYDQARKNLRGLKEADMQDVFEKLQNTPLVGPLRSAWSRELYRRGNWQSFLDHYDGATSTTGQCRYIDALYQTRQVKAALDAVESLWLVGHSQPKICDSIFERWRSAGRLTTDLTWERIALSMHRGQLKLARYLSRFLPQQEQEMARLWRQVYRQPELVADEKHFQRRHPRMQQILVQGYQRWSRRDVRAALQHWQQTGSQAGFSPDQIAAVERAIGKQLLRAGEANALDWLQERPASRNNDNLQVSWIFEAIRQERWQDALEALEQRLQAEPDEHRWQYWKARSLEALGRKQDAGQLFAEIATDRGYYGFLAADHIQAPYHIEHHPLPVDQDIVAQMLQHPAIIRTRELLAVDRNIDARREWRELSRDLGMQQIIAISMIAQSWGWHDRAILTIAKIKMFDDMELRFPLAHLAEVQRNGTQLRLDPAWILAVVRQESIFSTDVRSAKGATGLMQLMPATARRVSKRIGTVQGKPDLTNPSTNIALGSHYLKQMLDRFDQNRVLAISAYNAGPGRTRKWLDFGGSMPADLWIERVPFKETRNYLKRVLTYTAIYQFRLGQEPQPLSLVMRTVVGQRQQQAGPVTEKSSS